MSTFAECVLAGLSTRLLVLDEDLTIVYVNPAYCELRDLSEEQVIGKNIAEVFPATILQGAGLAEPIRAALREGQRVRWSGYRQATADHGERIVNIRLDPCLGPEKRHYVLLTIEDITERHRQIYQQNILRQITQAMLGIIELPRLLHAILTGLTAGGAIGLGFNRAILLLIDEQEQVLRAEMAVGPENAQQAGETWTRISNEHLTLQDFLAEYDSLPPLPQRPLYDLVLQLVFPTDETDILPMAAVANQQTTNVTATDNNQPASEELRRMLSTDEFVVAPLVVKDQSIGAIIADNCITGQPISDEDVQLLTVLANHAALAIDNARVYEELRQRVEELDKAYRQLEAAQQEVIRAEKLSTIGEVTAIVAHEIRNPLATIGGFAQAISRQPDDDSRIQRNANIIAEEVQRLEQILQNLLDFTKPVRPELVLHDVQPIIESIAEMISQEVADSGVELVVEVQPGLPEIYLDERQLRQIILNLTKNAVEAMPGGGRLLISAQKSDNNVEISVSDTGKGIPAEYREEIFDTFFTTKRTGTGLGLSLTRRIVQEHGGELYVSSQPGEGSTFDIAFPIPTQSN